MRAFKKAAVAIAATITTAGVGAPAFANNDPGDYTPALAGQSLLVLYNFTTLRDKLSTPTGDLSQGTHLDSNVTVIRPVHFIKIGPFVADPQFLLPVGWVGNGKVGGQRLNHTSGVGDITPAITLWVLNRPDPDRTRYFGLTVLITAPIGKYDYKKPVNLGGNRWVYDAQAGGIYGLNRHLLFDLTGDFIWYGRNDKFGIDKQTLKQNMTVSFNSWLRYNITHGPTLSVGWNGTWGGRQFVDGSFNGTRTDHQQIQAAIQGAVGKSLLLEGLVGHDVQVRDGFRQNLVFEVRLLKIFGKGHI